MIRLKSLFIAFILALPALVTAASGNADGYRYPITFTDQEITIDGVLSEGIWDSVPVAGDFWMSYPVDDRRVEARLQTEVRMTYNGQYLYIAAVCHGPQDYVIKTLKRDAEFWDSDGFGLVIDPVNEKTNGFTFGVSPAGVQTEYLVTGLTGRRADLRPGELRKGVNLAWDNKWFSEVTQYPDRWVVEIAIPFKTLRFEESRPEWGINFFRRDRFPGNMGMEYLKGIVGFKRKVTSYLFGLIE